MEYAQQIIGFFDGSDLKLVHVSEEVKNNLQVKNERGRQFRIPMKNVLVAVQSSSFEQYSNSYASLETKINDIREEVDSELLWEMVFEDPQNYSLEELADHYFGEKESFALCALFMSLVADTVHFKRKGINFTPRSAQQVEEQLLVIKRKKEKEDYLERLMPWVNEIIKAEEVSEIPEEFKNFLNQLQNFLYNKKANEASKILTQILGDRSLRDAIYDLLIKCDYIDKNSDRFLVLAGIEERFSQRVLENAETVEPIESHNEHRVDFGDLLSFSIDDEETQDIDDALSLEYLEDGTRRVGIHITDLSAYVADGDVMDEEASKRVTSIYLPTRTVNMFPKHLSQNLASLVEGEKRPCMSFIADFSEDGEMTDWKIKLSFLSVTHRLSYNQADEMIEDSSSDLNGVLADLTELSLNLRDQRLEKGAALFNRPELKIRVFDGKPDVKLMSRTSASRNLVGEFMILANSIAARYCVRNDVPIIYRTQEIAEGLPELDPDNYDPLLFEQAIKCMKKSRLSLHPQSHGGLGADFYTQLTSPIRRYTDMVMQRQLTGHLLGHELPYEAEELMAVIASAETVNSEVRDVQRSADNYWLHEFIRLEMTGEECEAIVISKAPGGYQVELLPLHNRTRLMTPEKLTPGDLVKVLIEKVKPKRNLIQLLLQKQ
ncbi:MAG: RNB domain-containing ribonuclease [Lentisphaeraceae bacterium]|nr:RNB domain-containing ribonuclease [Lentisphaeraceae bacterium]